MRRPLNFFALALASVPVGPTVGFVWVFLLLEVCFGTSWFYLTLVYIVFEPGACCFMLALRQNEGAMVLVLLALVSNVSALG